MSSWLSVHLLAPICFRPFDSKNPFLAPVTVNRRLNKGGSRHLMHLELDITGSKIRSVRFPLILSHTLQRLSVLVFPGMNRETTLPFSPQTTPLSSTSWDKSLAWTLTLLSLSTTLMVIHRGLERTLSLRAVTFLRVQGYVIFMP